MLRDFFARLFRKPTPVRVGMVVNTVADEPSAKPVRKAQAYAQTAQA